MSGQLSSVMTVMGPIPPDELGMTLPHEHLLADLNRITRNSDGILNDPELAIRELAAFRDAGGRSLVEVTSGGFGRDPEGLRRIAAASKLNIIMGTGWYREPYYPPDLDHRTTNELADIIVCDIQVGVESTGIRAGIIGEIGADWDYISGIEERVFRAAARAHRQTGVTITTHAVRCPLGLAQLDLLAEEGVSPRRVIIGHCDLYPDPAYHEAVAARGAWVQFDRCGGKSTYEIERRVSWIVDLVGKGHLGRLLLSTDNCYKSDLRAYGGTGYDFILTGMRPRLLEAGLTTEQIDQIVAVNPRRALTGED